MMGDMFDGDVEESTKEYTFEGGHQIRVRCVPADNQHIERWVPHVVWSAAVEACRAIAADPKYRGLFEGRTVVELGSGTGLGGLLAGSISKKPVVLTDGSDLACDSIKDSVALNPNVEVAAVEVLRWGDLPACEALIQAHGGPFDVVLATDVVYEAEFVLPLLKSACCLCKPGGLIFLANHRYRFRNFLEITEQSASALALTVEEKCVIGKDVDLVLYRRALLL